MAKTMLAGNIDTKENEAIAAAVEGEGMFGRLSLELARTVINKAKGIERTPEQRRAEIDGSVNAPYKTALAALRQAGELERMYPMAGVHAMSVCFPDKIKLEVHPFEAGPFVRTISDSLRRYMGRPDGFLAMVYDDGVKRQLLAVWYADIGFVPAAGIPASFAEYIAAPFLRPGGVDSVWEDPMDSLPPDQQKRLELMLKNAYGDGFPGMNAYVDKYAHLLGHGEESRLMSLTAQPDLNSEAAVYMGPDRLRAVTPAGYRSGGSLPEIFAKTLAVMQTESTPHMGGRVIINGIEAAAAPPVTKELLDGEGLELISAEYTQAEGQSGVTVRFGIDVDGEEIVRVKTYQPSRMIDVGDFPAVVQVWHMDGVSDDDWQGRLLYVTNAVASDRNDLDDMGVAVSDRPDITSAVLPNGKPGPQAIRVSGRAAEWAVVPSKSNTRYVTMLSGRGEEVYNLITPPSGGGAKPIRRAGKGMISVDCGTTTTHIEVVADDVNEPASYIPEIDMSQMYQPLSPMSHDDLLYLGAIMLTPSFTGATHPTAVRFFHSENVAPAVMNRPKYGGDLMLFTSSELARIMGGRDARNDIVVNMKAEELSSVSARAQRGGDAYAIAIASFVLLAYLHLLSRGQREIKILFAYPKGLRSNRVFREAQGMVSAAVGREVRWEAIPESFAAGVYIRDRKPDGLPITYTSPLVVADLGGMSIDVDASIDGRSLTSVSYSYASNTSQLGAGLALMRAPHAGASSRWARNDAGATLNCIFTQLASASSDDQQALAATLTGNISAEMRGDDTASMLEVPFDNKNRKLLEQLFRTSVWAVPMTDSLIPHWFQLWTLPILDIIAESLRGIGGSNGIVAFVGSGSIFLEQVLDSDPAFKARAAEYVKKQSGVAPFFSFVADRNKPEVAQGMLIAHENGLDWGEPQGVSQLEAVRQTLAQAERSLPEDASQLREQLERMKGDEFARPADAARLAGRCVAASVTRESYDAFVKRLAQEAVIDREQDSADSYGINTVYELLIYSPETLGGFNSFESIVEETLNSFPSIADNGEISGLILHYLVAFNIANRNLLRLQRQTLAQR